ncbi:MAG: HD-GYP domain-containing protein [Gemmatimonadota bacterium]
MTRMRRKKAAVIASLVAIVAVLHFATPAGAPGWRWAHVLFQKLYYVPLLMAAYCLGVRGTVATAAAVTALFLVHILVDRSGGSAARAEQFGEIASIWVIAVASMVLFNRERCALEQAEEAHKETLSVLASTLEMREHETALHSSRVRDYTLLLADRMGLDNGDIREQLRTGAFFHDVGKIGVPDSILLKGEGLSEAEWTTVRQHPDSGAALIGKMNLLGEAREMVRSHHEKFDGTGYPAGLAGEKIPVGARIFAVADVLDALTTTRPYRPASPFREAAEHIRRGRGTHFDPAVVDAFLRIPFSAWAEAARRNGVTLRES